MSEMYMVAQFASLPLCMIQIAKTGGEPPFCSTTATAMLASEDRACEPCKSLSFLLGKSIALSLLDLRRAIHCDQTCFCSDCYQMIIRRPDNLADACCQRCLEQRSPGFIDMPEHERSFRTA